MRRLDALAQFSSETDALTRLYLTPQHKDAAETVMAWMRQAGMAAHIDAAGNVVGRYDGATPDAAALLIGSHIDTVRNAGRFDGNLGVIAGIQAVAELHEAGERLPFAIEVIAFGDEEGVRFPVTLTGSRAIAGGFDAASLDAEDDAHVTLREALRRFGCEPGDIAGVARRKGDVIGYLELHIEQGPVLEAEHLPLGIVTAISGGTRAWVNVTGVAGHAGTVPPRLRRDALTAAAEMVLAAEHLALSTPNLVATVGRLEVIPGAVNVIPGGTRFSLDIRSPDDAARHLAVAALRHAFQEVATRRGVGLSVEIFYDAPAAVCAPWLINALEAAVTRLGLLPRRLPSGAGHDGLAMAALCPIGMLFVRCAGGISHNPAESITTEDADIAVRVLLDCLRHLEADRTRHDR